MAWKGVRRTAAPAALAGGRPRPGGSGPRPSPTPPPPRLPRDFRGKGRWIVRDGDSQLAAGGPQYPIWFTNLIYRDTLCTLTYKWPGLYEHPCSRIPGFNLESLNRRFENVRFVGRQTLRRTPQRHVNHWRVGVVFPDLPPGNHPRVPLALGDIHVDEEDRGTFWQALRFGVQNLYDPELDEWLVMDTHPPRHRHRHRHRHRTPDRHVAWNANG